MRLLGIRVRTTLPVRIVMAVTFVLVNLDSKADIVTRILTNAKIQVIATMAGHAKTFSVRSSVTVRLTTLVDNVNFIKTDASVFYLAFMMARVSKVIIH